MPDGRPLLELRDVSAGYGSIQILHGVSLHVNPGEVGAVNGPDGAGKSTTFKVIMGLIRHLLNFVDYLKELPYFAAEVLPRLERLGLRAAPSRQPISL